MKIFKYMIYSLLFMTISLAANAQKKEKEILTCEFEVQGVCKMCKERIEEAALIRGVKMAEWDKSTGILKAVYRKDKIAEIDIHKAIAAVGHATDQMPADVEAYKKLPDCCAYNGGVTKH